MEQLKRAIEGWAHGVQGPYQRGLAALYRQQYEEASRELQRSVTQQEGELADKYAALGLAEHGRGRYSAGG